MAAMNVSQLQTWLNILMPDRPLTVSGVYDPMTVSKVRAYQVAHNILAHATKQTVLRQDGSCDLATYEAIKKDAARS